MCSADKVTKKKVKPCFVCIFSLFYNNKNTFLRLTLALYIFLEKEMFTVEYSVGKLRNPVAQNQHAGATNLQIELNVTMTIDEKVNVGMRLLVFFRVNHKVFALLASVGAGAASGLVGTIAVGRPA